MSEQPTPTAPDPAPSDHVVPVAEAIRHRKRAQAAEQQLDALKADLAARSSALDDAQATIARLERRQRIDELLAESEAVDLEVARLLTEAAVADMSEPDLEQAVSDLRRHKPYLFRQRAALTASAMPAREHDAPAPTDAAAEQALATGHRRDLLRYLRLRRAT